MTSTLDRPPTSERTSLRVPPHSREAEEAVLGAILLSDQAANEVMDKLASDDFYVPAHQSIFEAIVALYNSNQPLDAVTVSEELRRRGNLEKVGGVGYLTRLVEVVPAASNIEYYATIVEEHGLRRSLIRAGSTVTDLAFRTDDEIALVIDRAEQQVLSVAEKRGGQGMLEVGPLFQDVIERIESLEANGADVTGLATGFRDLDRKLAGLQPANLVVIAARPSMGKCLAEGTRVVDPKTGALIAVERLFEDRDLQAKAHVLSLDHEHSRLVTAAPSAIAFNGVREVFRLTTRLGREVTATANHPLLTIKGWRELAELRIGDEIAVPRCIDAFGVDRRSDAEVRTLVDSVCHRGTDRLPDWAFRLPSDQLLLLLKEVTRPQGFISVSHRLSRDIQHVCSRFGLVSTRSLVGAEWHVTLGSEQENQQPSVARVDADVLWDPIVSIQSAGLQRTFDLCVPLYENLVADDVIVHNSALTLNIATNAASLGKVVALFSLEMSKEEVVQRILCSVGRVDSAKLRTGQLGAQNWDRVVAAAGKMYKAPIFIDDSSVVTVTDIRAKCRRLLRARGLDLVVVDYLQLMQGSSKENRQQEIAEISRGLKNLARELSVPVIAVSQLNRSVEQREDRRPRLSDLRECLAAETEILRSDTGQTITIGEIARLSLRDVPVWSMDDSMKLVPGVMAEAWSTGVKPVFKLTTASGRVVRATDNHPLRTLAGWTRLGDLKVGDRIAVPRRLPQPTSATPMNEDEVVLLGHMIGDGSYLPRLPLRYTSADPANHAAVMVAANRRFGVGIKVNPLLDRSFQTRLVSPYHVTHGRRNPICSWLDQLGIYGERSPKKRLPQSLFSVPDPQIRLFLHHLWATDGSISIRTKGDRVGVYFASSSQGLARDVVTILLRVDLQPRLVVVDQGAYEPGWHVVISGGNHQRRFLTEVGCHGARGSLIPQALAVIDARTSNTNVDTIPVEVWDQIRNVARTRKLSLAEIDRRLGLVPSSVRRRVCPSRARLAEVAQVLDDPHLASLARSDVLWDRVVSIESDGSEEVFDASVPSTNNFVASLVLVHNSGALEQDSDVVMFIYRHEYYHPDDLEKKGLAEVNIAKHRAGATGAVEMTFLPDFTRFADIGRDLT